MWLSATWATIRRTHSHTEVRRWTAAEPVAHAHQVGVAAFTHTAIGAVGAGSVVNAAHQRPFRLDQCLHLKAEVVEKRGVVLAERLLVVADVGVEAHAFKERQAQPGLQPGPHTKAPGEFAEGLGRCVGVGNRLVEFAALLFVGVVQQSIGIKFQGQGAGAQQALVQADAPEVFRPQAAIKQKGVAEVGIDHLPAPHRGGPGVGAPVGHGRQRRRAGHGLRRGGQRHRRHLPGISRNGFRQAGGKIERCRFRVERCCT